MQRAVIRLPVEVVDRLDQLAAKLRAVHPGRSYSRAALVRALIAGGLAVAEAQVGLEAPPPEGAAEPASSGPAPEPPAESASA